MRAKRSEHVMHEQCEDWVLWARSLRLHEPSMMLSEQLSRLAATPRPMARHVADIKHSAELAALHIAITNQPDALDRRVFELHYVVRVTHIKAAAAALGISRQHWYRLLRAFRERVGRAAAEILWSSNALREVTARARPAAPLPPGGNTQRIRH